MTRLATYFWCLLCALPLFAHAVSGDLVVRTPVGDDTTPPSVPTLLTATPIAATQIDLAWNPSTDDYELTGYTIARDGQHIATTSLTTFSDTGLTAETLYEYTVRAYDWLLNFSTSSNALATTTLALPPPAPTSTPTSTVSESTASASGRLFLQSGVIVTTDRTKATIAWETNRPSRFALRWGQTTSYELGFVTTERYREAHTTTLTDLLPGTTYEYEIIGYNAANNIPQVLRRGQFTTAASVQSVPPTNVLRLTAVVDGEDAVLGWQNPAGNEGQYVRVVRSHFGYPTDINDGMVVYQGGGEEVRDAGALSAYGTQYYTVFVVGGDGAVSSGAVASVRRGEAEVVSSAGATTTPQPPLTPPEVLLPSLAREHIRLTQNGVLFTFADPIIVLSSELPFLLSIPKEALPPHLKSIIVTLLDPSDHRRSYRFLLRSNTEGTAYEAMLAPLAVSGVSQLMVEVYDYEAKVVGRYGKQIEFAALAINETDRVVFPDAVLAPIARYLPYVYTVSGAFFLFLLFLIWRRRAGEGS